MSDKQAFEHVSLGSGTLIYIFHSFGRLFGLINTVVIIPVHFNVIAAVKSTLMLLCQLMALLTDYSKHTTEYSHLLHRRLCCIMQKCGKSWISALNKKQLG